MPVRRKVFRIEEMHLANARRPARATDAAPAEQRASCASSRRCASLSSAETGRCARSFDADDIAIADLRRLRDETDSIHRAIARTKQEIAALHMRGSAPTTAACFASSTRSSAAPSARSNRFSPPRKTIDEAANTLSAILKREQDQALAAGHPRSGRAHLRSLQFSGPRRPAHRQGDGDAEIRRGTHRAHDGDLGRHRRVQGHTPPAAAAERQGAGAHQRPEARRRRRATPRRTTSTRCSAWADLRRPRLRPWAAGSRQARRTRRARRPRPPSAPPDRTRARRRRPAPAARSPASPGTARRCGP